jgi:hypothetical protein
MPGGEVLSGALRAGLQGGQAARVLSKKGALRKHGSRGALQGLLYGLGGDKLTDDQFKMLKSGKFEDALSSYTKDMDEAKARRMREVFRSIGDPMEEKTLLRAGRQSAAARALGMTGRRPEDSLLRMSEVTAKKDMTLIGRLGAPQGMHAEMMRQTRVLMEIRDATKNAGKGTPSSGSMDKKAST